jgi:hypothetical protein
MSYGDFGHVDIVVEAVVENPKIKQSVLAEVEGLVRDDAIIASNTSTISISLLAQALKRPENFCGMHFFNPVHMMPLVEVIRGEKTSEPRSPPPLPTPRKWARARSWSTIARASWSTACCSRTSAASPVPSLTVWTLSALTR